MGRDRESARRVGAGHVFARGSGVAAGGPAVGMALVVALLAATLLTGTASGANHAVECGEEITEDTTLTADIGPCLGHGLVIVADDVTLDLGGHAISGAPVGQPVRRTPDGTPLPGSYGEPNNAGVLLVGVSGVTVTNGTVEHFDAGVAIEGGSDNTVTGLTAQDNVHHTRTPPCEYGDGIAIFDSARNRVEGNAVRRNGPFSGISLVGTSADNVVADNVVEDHAVRSLLCGRDVQSVGIRIEGPGAQRNTVAGNDVTNGSLAGIGVHTYECGQPANSHNVIDGNVVRDTGRDTHQDDPIADGIAVMEMGPAGIVCPGHDTTISNNEVVGNYRHGIYLGREAFATTVRTNVARDNAEDGIRVVEGASGGNRLGKNLGSGNGGYDGSDFNDGCVGNRWRANTFGTVNQPCVRGPGSSGDALGQASGTGVARDRDAGPINRERF